MKKLIVYLLIGGALIAAPVRSQDITPPNNALNGPNGSTVRINADGSITITTASGQPIGVYGSTTRFDTGPMVLGAISTPAVSGATDINLYWDGSHVYASKNGGAYAIFGEGASIATTIAILKGDNAGGASAATAGTDYVKPGTATVGHLLFTDNLYDIGQSGATRPRSGYFAGLVQAENCFLVGGVGRLTGTADGVWYLTNLAQNNFSRLMLGGTTSSFPAIKRSAASIDFRLADDSGYASISASDVSAAGGGSVQTTNLFYWASKSVMRSGTDGNIQLSNNANTGFGLLQLGGISSSFPAIKRNGTAINFRLADDSADAPITAGAGTFSGGIAVDGTRQWNASGFQMGPSDYFQFNAKTYFTSPADGKLALFNNAGTGFTAIQLGGTTSSFPAIKRNATAINFRLADDSADAPITASTGTFSDRVRGTGNAASPALSFVGGTNAGFYGDGNIYVSAQGIYQASFQNGQFTMARDNYIGFESAGAASSPDLKIYRDAADILAQRRDTNAQTFRVYETTNAGITNYNRVSLQTGMFGAHWGGFVFEKGGTGNDANMTVDNETNGGIVFRTNATSRWQIDSTGNLLAWADNTYDIGASGATRPRNGYFGGGIVLNTTGVTPSAGGIVSKGGITLSGMSSFGGTVASDGQIFLCDGSSTRKAHIMQNGGGEVEVSSAGGYYFHGGSDLTSGSSSAGFVLDSAGVIGLVDSDSKSGYRDLKLRNEFGTGYRDYLPITAPGTPGTANSVRVYASSGDGKLHAIDSGGTDHALW